MCLADDLESVASLVSHFASSLAKMFFRRFPQETIKLSEHKESKDWMRWKIKMSLELARPGFPKAYCLTFEVLQVLIDRMIEPLLCSIRSERGCLLANSKDTGSSELSQDLIPENGNDSATVNVWPGQVEG